MPTFMFEFLQANTVTFVFGIPQKVYIVCVILCTII